MGQAPSQASFAPEHEQLGRRNTAGNPQPAKAAAKYSRRLRSRLLVIPLEAF